MKNSNKIKMTKQEYIQNESESYRQSKRSYMCVEAFLEGHICGLQKGLNVVESFSEWVVAKYVKTVGGWLKIDIDNFDESRFYVYPTEELLQIYLTQNENK